MIREHATQGDHHAVSIFVAADRTSAVRTRIHVPDTARFTTIPVPYGRSDAGWFLEHVATGWADGSLAAFAIEVTGRFAGSADLQLQESRWAEVGFGLTPRARGRGVMTRALRLLVEWGFTELALDGIQWRAVVGNEGSRRVAQKCGFAMEGSVRGLLIYRGRRLDGWIGTLLCTDHLPVDRSRCADTVAE